MTMPERDELSVALRGLARDAQRLAIRGDATAAEAAVLSGRIDRVRRRAQPGPSAPLRRWLDRLQRLVEGLAHIEDSQASQFAMRLEPQACGLIPIRAPRVGDIENQPAT